ncbi:hypothetical protein [Actinoplanes sp. HUAS TT8]|uniref:hypothetical protein n=1 Tax=Actinoplanes sp. HUAS TT8 TaxID=3447453 RepID=UPI003F51C8D4
MARVYVETVIAAPLERIWAATQDPREHVRWDVRFGRIDPVADGEFTYATAVLPGVEIAGYGVHSGERRQASGEAVSALRFGSDDVRSLIREGSGYWRYVPADHGVRFLTGYAYRPRWGRLGRLIDLVFGPVFGWATAWSFDRLRLWLERGVTPERARWHAVLDLALRAAVIAVALHTHWWLLVVPAILLPPHPLTPAARRCRRQPRPSRREPRRSWREPRRSWRDLRRSRRETGKEEPA